MITRYHQNFKVNSISGGPLDRLYCIGHSIGYLRTLVVQKMKTAKMKVFRLTSVHTIGET